jgi:uncharacterized NAD-dependent epimerase/dehydratase family protein
MSRRLVVLIEGCGNPLTAKTAINVIRYRPEQVVAVYDSTAVGKTSGEILGVGGDLPVIGSLDRAPGANTLLIGIAPPGGRLPAPMRRVVLDAIERGWTIESGLHEFLSDDPEFSAAAARTGAVLRDVRKNDERDVANRQDINERCLRIHTVGNDCSVGKMVAAVELTAGLKRAGHDAKFVATGQTGIMIEGDGCPIDRVISDFVSGAAEKLVLANQHHEIIVVEGQACLTHPRYSAVTLGLLHGTIPDGLVLCYEAGREHIYGMEPIPVPSLREIIRLNEIMAGVMHPCRVIGVAMNGRRLTADQAQQEQQRVEDELKLPVCDVLREGPEKLVAAVLELKKQLRK